MIIFEFIRIHSWLFSVLPSGFQSRGISECICLIDWMLQQFSHSCQAGNWAWVALAGQQMIEGSCDKVVPNPVDASHDKG